MYESGLSKGKKLDNFHGNGIRHYYKARLSFFEVIKMQNEYQITISRYWPHQIILLLVVTIVAGVVMQLSVIKNHCMLNSSLLLLL